jgi:hypothetical protein
MRALENVKCRIQNTGQTDAHTEAAVRKVVNAIQTVQTTGSMRQVREQLRGSLAALNNKLAYSAPDDPIVYYEILLLCRKLRDVASRRWYARTVLLATASLSGRVPPC